MDMDVTADELSWVMHTATALGHAPDVAHPFNPAHRRRYKP